MIDTALPPLEGLPGWAGALPVSLPVLAACIVVMSMASVVFGMSGFGASLITVPLLSQLVPLPLLLSMTVASDLMSACIVALTTRLGAARRRAVAASQGAGPPAPVRADRAELLRLGCTAVFGAALGVTLLVGLPRQASMAALGVFLLSYGIWSLRSRIPDRPLSARWAWPSGFIGGLLGTLFGIGGPPYVIYLSRRIMDRDRLRATIAVIVLISLLIRFLVFMAAGLLLQPGLPALLAVVLPLCALGVLAGGRLVERLSRERLLRVIAAVLTISGALLLVRVVAG
ncbi:MAG: sulfite exporter TauE/SafE family protein [Pseudomonadota bacterium]